MKKTGMGELFSFLLSLRICVPYSLYCVFRLWVGGDGVAMKREKHKWRRDVKKKVAPSAACG